MKTEILLSLSVVGLSTARALFRYADHLHVMPIARSVALGAGGLAIWFNDHLIPRRIRFKRKQK
jgi:hypothetical protein